MNYIKIIIGNGDDLLYEAITDKSLSEAEEIILNEFPYAYVEQFYGIDCNGLTLEQIEEIFENQSIPFFTYFYFIEQI